MNSILVLIFYRLSRSFKVFFNLRKKKVLISLERSFICSILLMSFENVIAHSHSPLKWEKWGEGLSRKEKNDLLNQKEIWQSSRFKARIGEEDRVIAPVNQYPFTAIGSLWIPHNFLDKSKGGYNQCTGVLVDSHIVLTNAHCVALGYKRMIRQHIHFSPAHQLAKIHPIFGVIPVKDIIVPESYWRGELGSDYALLVLEEPIGFRTGWFGSTKMSLWQSFLEDFYLAGYAINTPFAPHKTTIMTVNKKPCKAIGPIFGSKIIIHDCDTGEGSSGSPFWFYDENMTPWVVGTNFSGLGPRGDQRMNSCYPFLPPFCSNFVTSQSQYIDDLLQLKKRYPVNREDYLRKLGF